MKINSADSTNTRGLHVKNATLKKIGCTRKMLLNNPSIRDCAEKYDVLVTPGCKKYVINRHDGFTKDKYLPAAYLGLSILSAPHIPEWMTMLGITNLQTMFWIGIGMFAFAGLSIIKLITKRLNEINVQGASNVDKYDKLANDSIYNDEFVARGASTPIYSVKRNADGVIDDVPELTKTIFDNEYKYFYNNVIKKSDIKSTDSPKEYLEQLNTVQTLAKKRHIKDVFKFPINKGGDTLLTMFFDLKVPSKEDKAEFNTYNTILKEVSKTDKDNFYQKDSQGITILEKIIKSENEYILPILKDVKFNYTPYIKDAYDNIRNQDFKNQLKQSVDLNFDLLEKK